MNDELKYLLSRAAQGKYSRRAFMGKAAAFGMTAAMANTLLATAVRAEGPVKGGTLLMGLGGGESTNSLDPALAASQVPFHVLRTSGEPLVDVTADGQLDMRLAESVESSADAKTWMFKIRQGAEFHNGKTVTPDDVLATLLRHSDEKAQSGALGIMQGIESMKVDGDMVVVTLSTANADLPYLMADYHLMIQPEGGVANPADGIGAGAYKIIVNEPGVRHTFEKHANYWDSSRGHYYGVEFLVINDATARMAAIQSGQVHIANRVEPKVAGLLARAPGLTVKNVSGRGHYVFIMHANTAPFDNKDLRLALKYAIDRQEMVDKILQGYGSIGNDIPINAAYPLFDESLPQRAFDLEKAAEHYKASGHDGSPIILRVSDVAFPGAIDAAALFQQSAAKAGIPLEIKREPGDGYWSEVWNKQPFCASYWGGRPVQDQMYSTAYQSTADWNDTRFFNPKFDETLLAARGELDQTKRKAMYAEMAAILHDEGGLICPMFNDFIEAVGDKVQGWETDGVQEVMNGLAPHKTWLA
ncbi:ABC transporter substrate-binding protein [Fertoebacter nigrum]|uniref:ABC transporter substrate-binding protein n=1 Tax=Fertoeibacter niger TaxID=2656921 RepID=A0A8X8KRE0_9RHOB|nr:ABC transporter substrate-binding protein [Fertoeibacter niger]NUB45112.1 ABC transporter substrate-binding protein [Fertoeibacter niger]